MSTVLGVSVAAFGSVSNAQLSATGPFVGNLSETFESFKNFCQNGFAYESSPASVFGGAATLSQNNMFVYTPGGCNFGLGTSGAIGQTSDGVKAMGIDAFNLGSVFTFAAPIYSFGGFFGANTNFGDPATFTFDFYDSGNNQIGSTQSLSYSHSGSPDGGLDWYGFDSTSAVSKVVVTGTEYAFDGLQINTNAPRSEGVPEPGIFLSLVGAGTIGGLAVIRKRKRA